MCRTSSLAARPPPIRTSIAKLTNPRRRAAVQIRQMALAILLVASAACQDAGEVQYGGPSAKSNRTQLVSGALVISSPLTLDKTSVVAGDTLGATVTYQNTSSIPISVQAIVIAGRPPGATDAGGPYQFDLTPALGSQTIPAGGSVTLNAARAFTASDPTGSWCAFATYQDGSGVWYKGPDVGVTVAQPAAGGLVISTPLTLDETNVDPGVMLEGTVTYQNTRSSAISILGIAIGGRPPGGTNAGGPYDDLTPPLGAQTIAAGASVTLAASRAFTASDPTGSWYAFATYQDASGVWHDGPSVNFTVAAAAATPSITPGTGSSSSSVNATIACPTTGTLPHRTTDGSTPTTSSTQSSTATFSSSGTLKAICAGGGYAASAVASATYTITGGSGGLVMSSPLTLDKTIVAPGGTVNGTVTYQNTSSAAISLLGIAIAGRPPGGSNAGGPYDDLSRTLAAQTIAPGASVTLTASRAFTAGDLLGSWYTYATYQDAGGAWHDGPPVSFTVVSAVGGLAISSPLTLDKTNALSGDTVTGTVTYMNTSASPIAIQQLVIAAVPPSPATQQNFTPNQAATTVPAGATLTLTASRAFTSADPTGSWQVKSSYQDAAGAWHDGAGVNLTVGPLTGSGLLGANIEGVNDWDPTQLFADAMKQARHFGSVGTPWDEAAPVDANGWPTGDAEVVVIETNPGAWVAGTYALSFTGRATVASDSARPGVSISNVVYSGGVTTATVTATTAISGLWLQFTGTSGGVKNVSLMRPTKAGTPHAAGAIFTDRFLDRLKYFSTLRFMDYLSTNNTTQALWSDRVLPGKATQQSQQGSAYEYIILLANQSGKDVWITIPHLALGSTYALASTTYLKNLANLFKYGSDGVNPYTSPQVNPIYPPLNPSLHLYVEFSNELWNGVFPQNQWISAQAQAAINARDPDLCYDGTTHLRKVNVRLMGKGAMGINDTLRALHGDAGIGA